jgi:hypothetical protein
MNTRSIHWMTVISLVMASGASRLEARPDDASATLATATYAEPVYVPVGFYTGTCSSPAMAGGSIPFLAQVFQVQGKHHARLICQQPGEKCYEDWTWDDRSLIVTRHVFYSGTRGPEGRREDVSQLRGYMSDGRYRVICQDPAGIDCGMGLPAGSYLTIATVGDGFRCEIWQRQSTNQPSQVALLRAFDFNPAQ